MPSGPKDENKGIEYYKIAFKEVMKVLVPLVDEQKPARYYGSRPVMSQNTKNAVNTVSKYKIDFEKVKDQFK